MPGNVFSKINFPKLDFLKAVSVTLIANSGIMKMKKSNLILVSATDFFIKFLALPNFLESFSSPLKKGVGWDRKLMCFHLKIYVILFNSFSLFLLEHIGVFWMFLLLPAVEWDLTNPWKLFKPNELTWQLSFWDLRIWRWFTIIDYTLQNTLQDHMHLLHQFISLIF